MTQIIFKSEHPTQGITEVMIEDHVANLFYIATFELPKDVFNRLNDIYNQEIGPNAKEATRQIIENAVKARNKNRPMCQDTGFPVVFVEFGQNANFHGDINAAINRGVAKGYKDNFLRKSMVKDPVFNRVNTGDNTPAIIHVEFVPGDAIKIMVEPKGTGSESMSTHRMLKPSQGVEGIKEFIIESIFKAGANPCPPILLGIGIGGTFEKSAVMAKRALFDPIQTPEELKAAAEGGNSYAGLALEIMDLVNKTGVGSMGLGGIQMCIGVNIRTFGTHIGALPVALNVQCHAARHAEAMFYADGTVEYLGEHITGEESYEVSSGAIKAKAIHLETPLSDSAFLELKAGDRVLISGTLYTARDAAHRRMLEEFEVTGKLPIDLTNQILYYVGPVPAIEGEIIGPAGPTTSGRMDKYTPFMLDHGLKGMIGKGYRTEEVKASIRQHGAVYFIAVGGAAVVIQECIEKAEVIAYPELGPEAIYKLEVKDFPAIVALDAHGGNIHEEGREEYRKIPLI